MHVSLGAHSLSLMNHHRMKEFKFVVHGKLILTLTV